MPGIRGVRGQTEKQVGIFFATPGKIFRRNRYEKIFILTDNAFRVLPYSLCPAFISNKNRQPV
jgi:hypothetical protein